LKTQLTDYRQVEKALKDTLVTAQENITASRQSSKREADIILREAELKAEKIIEGARNKLEKLKSDVMIIKAQKESFARRLRHLLESQIELINVLEMDDSGYESDTDFTGKKRPRMLPDVNRPGRRKVDIPPLKQEETFKPVSKTPERPTKLSDEKKKKGTNHGPVERQEKIPKISDQFIT
ncbi:MAG: DivIVA domain-containing protein, partial [bacterium]